MTKDGSAIVVGLGIHGGPARGLVEYALRPELKTQLGIVRNEFSDSALIAFILGAAAGLVVATLTGRRLTRIAEAARAIGGGDFSVRVADRLPRRGRESRRVARGDAVQLETPSTCCATTATGSSGCSTAWTRGSC